MRAWTVVLFLLAGAASGGCAAAGLAGAPLVAAVQVVADRSVQRTVMADLTTATLATEAVLRRASIAVKERQAASDRLTLRGSVEDLSVVATLEQVTPSMTRVSVRTETGGLLADRHTSERLQQQLAAALDAVPTPRTVDAQYLDALTTLEAEVRRLTERLETARVRRVDQPPAATPAAVPDARPALTIDPSGIVTVPDSYGFVAVNRRPEFGVPAVRIEERDGLHGSRQVAVPRAAETAALVLRPVSTLIPVGTATESRVGD